MSNPSPTPWQMNPGHNGHPENPKLWPAIFHDADGKYLGSLFLADGKGQGMANARLILESAGMAGEIARLRARVLELEARCERIADIANGGRV